MSEIRQLILDDLAMESGLPMQERCPHGRKGYERCPFCDPLPSTSVTRTEAATKMQPTKAKLREQVYETIREHGPVTDEQIANLTGMNPSTARPRRLELAHASRIAPAGYSRTAAGRRAVAWRVVPDPSV